MLVYNLQPLLLSEDAKDTKHPTSLYLTLDMIVKPFAQIDDTHHLVGRPLHLVTEAVSGNIQAREREGTKLTIECCRGSDE